MRVNVYAEELTHRVKVVTKPEKTKLTGICFYLELPATVDGKNYSGPFIHRPEDDDSSAVTFWGTPERLRQLLRNALVALGDK